MVDNTDVFIVQGLYLQAAGSPVCKENLTPWPGARYSDRGNRGARIAARMWRGLSNSP